MASISPTERSSASSQLLSGVILEQNLRGAGDGVQSVTKDSWVFQEFSLPSDYPRGVGDEQIIPPLTGFQVRVNIDPTYASTATLDYRLDHYLFGTGWVTATEGTSIGSYVDGNEVWFEVYFDDTVEVSPTELDDRWRFGINGRPAAGEPKDIPAAYEGGVLFVPHREYEVALIPNVPHAFDLIGAFKPDVLTGLEVWCRPETLSGNGDPISAWSNEGYGEDAIQTTSDKQPLVATNVLDGKKVVRLDGSDDELDITIPARAARTIFIVAKQATLISSRYVVGFGGAGSATIGNNGNTWRYLQDETLTTVDAGGTPTDWTAITLTVTDATDASIARNDTDAIPFDPNVQITTSTIMKLGQRGNNGSYWNGDLAEVIVYDRVLTGGEILQVQGYLTAKYPTLGTFGSSAIGGTTPAFALLDEDTDLVTYSVQQGVTDVWLSSPNPLANNFVRATDITETPILINGAETSLQFRLLAAVADEGVDFLGNPYRSAIRRNGVSNLDSIFASQSDTYWASKPNPSRFAVETIYFDVTDSDGAAQVIDRVLLDPITPNVYFHIYYSDEGDPGITESDWEDRLWTPVHKTYRAVKREHHRLPSPITCKYIAIEFSQLQPKPYNPGDFETPIRYKKHPRWVFDYFLARTELDQLTTQGNMFTPRRVGITYDALDLAYNYYLDDLRQEPDLPIAISDTQRNQVAAELTQTPSLAERVDSYSLSQIRLAFQQFQQHPGFEGIRYLLSDTVNTALDNYPVEYGDLPPAEYDVSALRDINKDKVVYEVGMPVMFFYLKSRHFYKEATATLTHNRAYFVGVRQILFSRNHYTVADDTTQYIETMGDTINMERNDF